MSKKIYLTGQRFGRLIVLCENGRAKNGHVLWLCKCDCGNEVTVRGNALRTGHTTSCGCLCRELSVERSTTHGMTKTRLYRIWTDMLARTGIYKGASERNKHDYQDRGITLCAEWKSFENFHDWSLSRGYSDDLEIDRIDNDSGYCPDNCRWVSRKENCNNRRNTLRIQDGMSLAMFCAEVGIQTRENGKVSKQYVRIRDAYSRCNKIHPELLTKANEIVALYKKTLALLKLQEEVRQFAFDTQRFLQKSHQESF